MRHYASPIVQAANDTEALNSSRNMNGGGRRQLPSWMLRPCTVEQASVSDVKQVKENDSEQLDAEASRTQKKVQRRKHDSGVPLVENKSHLLERCEARKRDRKSSQQEEDQYDNESFLRKQRKTIKGKRKYNQEKDRGREMPKSDMETVDGSMRKKYRGNTPGKKMTNKSKKHSHDGTAPSDAELTVEDLVSIAEEYLNANTENPENLQFNAKMRSSTIAEIISEKNPTPTAHEEDRNLDTNKPPSVKYISTDDPAQDMLDLFFGGFLTRPEEVERENDAIMKNIMLDHELSKTRKNDTVVEVVPLPAVKKRGSLKDKVALLLD